MSHAKKTAILNDIKRLQTEVAEFRECRKSMLLDGVSGSVSSGGGSKSFTNWSPEKLDAAIAKDLSDISRLKREYKGLAQFRIGHVQVRRV